MWLALEKNMICVWTSKVVSGGGGQYHSKRKQCLVASRTCFKCKVVFESGTDWIR